MTVTLADAAIDGTLEEFKQLYATDKSRESGFWKTLLLRDAIGDNDPESRTAKANFLLDDGADATWHEAYNGGRNLLHIFLSTIAGRSAVLPADIALLRRLLDAGADINGISPKSGTPLQLLYQRSVSYSDEVIVPLFDVIFARDDFDLFVVGAFKKSTYQVVGMSRDSVPIMWGYIERYIHDHGIVVPENQRIDDEN